MKTPAISPWLVVSTIVLATGNSATPGDASWPVGSRGTGARESMQRESTAEQIETPIGADVVVTSSGRVFDARGELLRPNAAASLLDRAEYFEWCLQWNRRQEEIAKQRAIAPRRITGWETKRRGVWQSSRTGGFYRGSRNRGNYESTVRSRQLVWYEGGYGGGPITLYNPYAPPRR